MQDLDSNPGLTMGQMLDRSSPGNLHKHLEAGFTIISTSQVRKLRPRVVESQVLNQSGLMDAGA